MFVGHKELAGCHAPVSNKDWQFVLENLRIIAHNDDMEAIVDIAASGFCSGIICLYNLDQTTVSFVSGLGRKSYDGGCASSSGAS